MSTSIEILADRKNHTPIAKTIPTKSEFGIKGVSYFTKWDDGVITSTYDYGEGRSDTLHVTSPQFFEDKFQPQWIEEVHK